jgi:hypothetical protein
MLAAGRLLAHAVDAVLGSQAALGNITTVTGLASVMTSFVKRAVQFVNAASTLQAAETPAATMLQPVGHAAASTSRPTDHSAATAASEQAGLEETAAACFPAVVPLLLQLLLPSAFLAAEAASLLSCDPASIDSSSSQAKASAAMLAVVLARGLVKLADAMDAAGP